MGLLFWRGIFWVISRGVSGNFWVRLHSSAWGVRHFLFDAAGLRLKNLSMILLAVFLPDGGLGVQTAGIDYKKLSVEQGLSNSAVYSLLQDRQGFIWVGTQNGLSRYDGYHFVNYNLDPESKFALDVAAFHGSRSGTYDVSWSSFSNFSSVLFRGVAESRSDSTSQTFVVRNYFR